MVNDLYYMARLDQNADAFNGIGLIYMSDRIESSGSHGSATLYASFLTHFACACT